MALPLASTTVTTSSLDLVPADEQDGNAFLGVIVALAIYPMVFAVVAGIAVFA